MLQLHDSNGYIYFNYIPTSSSRAKLRKNSLINCLEELQKQLVRAILITRSLKISEDLQKTSEVDLNFCKLSLGCIVIRSGTL